MGAFCGKFRDEHQSTEGSSTSEEHDDEDKKDKLDEMKPKDFNKAKKIMKKKKLLKPVAQPQQLAIGGGGKVQWAPYLSPIQVEVKTKEQTITQEFLKLKAVKAKQLSETMLESLCQINKIHTVEFIKCHMTDFPPNLQELESLAVVRMSHNDMASVDPELCNCAHLERIILDGNLLKAIDPGIFGSATSPSFPILEVINLSHNQLTLLPLDFGLGLEALRYIDVSFNELAVLPDAVCQCKSLQVVILSHNKMQKLPEQLGKLRDLRKLFCSFNLLHELPETIGDCRRLEKIRVISNYIRNMPLSIINLWKEMGGSLEEFLVDRNPLVHPSITAFEMGGLNQAMKLFKEYSERKKAELAAEAARLAEEAEFAMGDVGSRDGGPSGVPETMQVSTMPLPGGPSGASINEGEPKFAIADALADEDAENPVAQLHLPKEIMQNEYYFLHCKDDPQTMISDIRVAESTMLLLKKSRYVESQKILAQQKQLEIQTAGTGAEVPKHLQQFLQAGFDVTKYHDKVRVTDLDLYFNLLVFSTKPMLSTCALLFDKFQTAPDHKTAEGMLYIDRGEWGNLCTRVPVKLPPAVEQEMWNLMSWRDPHRIEERDFVAAWHIHDVEKRDEWIKRIARGLKLDYYDMDVVEMQSRLSAKGAEDADPTLDFDDTDSDDAVEVMNDDGDMVMPDKAEKPEHVLMIDMIEGERRLAKPHKPPAAAAAAAAPSAASEAKVMISLTEQEYSAAQSQLQAEIGSGDEMSDVSIGSDQLSEETMESDSSFDAEVFIVEAGEDEDEAYYGGGDPVNGQEETKKPQRGKKKMVIDSDEAIRKLMELPPEEILESEGKAKRTLGGKDAQAAKDAAQKKKKKKAKQRQAINDPRYKTDVFGVRQVLREVYRNLPHDDFVKLVNFLLRGMRYMKHLPPDRPSYWHADEPAFKHTMGERGTNPYTRHLLSTMGFVCVNELYWCWPALHLKPKKAGAADKIANWGDKVVPPSCPGRHKDRMEDMINLFRSCQRALNQRGENFRGSFN